MILSIEKDFLLSLIPGLVQGFKNNFFLSKSYLEQQYEDEINVQFYQSGNTFPVVLPLYGAIIKKTNYNFIGTQTYIKYIQLLEAHPHVSAIVLDIDSGGGMVSGTAELVHTIKQCKKPVIAFTKGYLCSAAYWIASGCKKIVASPFADYIGSIGTMLTAQDFSGMWEKWGAKFYELYAPQSSEKNIIWRELSQGNEQPATEHLSLLADEFIQSVKNARPQIIDDQKVWKGAIYSPEKAKEIGLIDDIASLEDILLEF